jgi:hypothetical protein
MSNENWSLGIGESYPMRPLDEIASEEPNGEGGSAARVGLEVRRMARVRVGVFVWMVSTAMVLAVNVPPAFAAPPGNDTIAGAVGVTTLPFTYEQDTSEATADGPRFCGNNSSVFFRFDPSDSGRFQVDTFDSDYDTVLSVFTGQGSSLRQVSCNDDRFGYSSGVRFRARAGTTYFIMVSTCCGSGVDHVGGSLALTVGRVATAPLDATFVIQGGVTDPLTGMVTVSGTMTCNQRSIVGLVGIMRQVRNQVFLARASLSIAVACMPGGSDTWTAEVETETSIVFGPGQASVASIVRYAWDGFRQFSAVPQPDQAISLT